VREELTEDQISLVLRRAAELDRDLAAPRPIARLDATAVEQAALEAGISQPAVRRAMAELRVGLLEAPDRPHRGLLGAGAFTVCRTVPGPLPAVQKQLDRFLRHELFELRRDQGYHTTWVRRRGLEASARRAIDGAVQRRLVLREVHHVDVSLVEHDPGWVLVRLDVDVLAIRHRQGTIAGSATFAGSSLAATTALVSGLRPGFMVASAVGLGIAGAGHWVGSGIYRRRVGDITSGVAGMLDRLEQGAAIRHGRFHAV
jgi:hypothetical protein